jgi:hypothetical protein
MVRELQLARRQPLSESANPEAVLSWPHNAAKEVPGNGSCQHRTVAKDGRIVCARIVEGENEVSPNVCRDCPSKAVNCSHLRFSLRQTSPSPLVVRYNGRTEIWDDGPCEISFERAACASKVMPIYGPQSCATCAMRTPIVSTPSAPRSRRPAAEVGKVVAFPSREPVVAAG